jgi:hypothetical protein
VNALERMQDLLPLPYSVAGDALLSSMLDVCALEVEALEESIDRLRRSHWIATAFRDRDVDRIAALVGIRRFRSEPSPFFRQRLLALITARLSGTIGVPDIEKFVRDNLHAVEVVFECTLLAGFGTDDPEQVRTPRVVEFPPEVRQCRPLADRGGRVTHLFRWSVTNNGLDPAPARFVIRGALGDRTTLPALIHVSTKTIHFYRGVIPAGRTLAVEQIEGIVRATLDGYDVTSHWYTLPFEYGQNITLPQQAAQAAVLMPRGVNEWQFATIGFWDERGYDRVHFLPVDPAADEAAFDRTSFDHSLFLDEPAAWVEMSWEERQPATFEVRVPRRIVIEPRTLHDDFVRAGETRAPHLEVGEDLAATVGQLRAAGVRAGVRFEPFSETQRQFTRFEPSFKHLPRERDPAGNQSDFGIGGRFGESPLGQARFN